jgi:hypothetical protein
MCSPLHTVVRVLEPFYSDGAALSAEATRDSVEVAAPRVEVGDRAVLDEPEPALEPLQELPAPV